MQHMTEGLLFIDWKQTQGRKDFELLSKPFTNTVTDLQPHLATTHPNLLKRVIPDKKITDTILSTDASMVKVENQKNPPFKCYCACFSLQAITISTVYDSPRQLKSLGLNAFASWL